MTSGEGSGLNKLQKMERTKKGEPVAVDRDICDVDGGERGENGQGKRQQKWHSAHVCRGSEGLGEQVKGENTAIVGKGGVGLVKM